MLSSRQRLRKAFTYFSKTMLNLILHLLEQHGFTVDKSGWWTGLPAAPLSLFRLLKGGDAIQRQTLPWDLQIIVISFKFYTERQLSQNLGCTCLFFYPLLPSSPHKVSWLYIINFFTYLGRNLLDRMWCHSAVPPLWPHWCTGSLPAASCVLEEGSSSWDTSPSGNWGPDEKKVRQN